MSGNTEEVANAIYPKKTIMDKTLLHTALENLEFCIEVAHGTESSFDSFTAGDYTWLSEARLAVSDALDAENRRDKGYCRRCDARHATTFCPDCGLKLVRAQAVHAITTWTRNADKPLAELLAHRIYCDTMCTGDPQCFSGIDVAVRNRWIYAFEELLISFRLIAARDTNIKTE